MISAACRRLERCIHPATTCPRHPCVPPCIPSLQTAAPPGCWPCSPRFSRPPVRNAAATWYAGESAPLRPATTTSRQPPAWGCAPSKCAVRCLRPRPLPPPTPPAPPHRHAPSPRSSSVAAGAALADTSRDVRLTRSTHNFAHGEWRRHLLVPSPAFGCVASAWATGGEPGVGTSAACETTHHTPLSPAYHLPLLLPRAGGSAARPLLLCDGANAGTTEAAAAALPSGVSAATGEHSSERRAVRLRCRRCFRLPAHASSPLLCLPRVSLCVAACCRRRDCAREPEQDPPAGGCARGAWRPYRATRGCRGGRWPRSLRAGPRLPGRGGPRAVQPVWRPRRPQEASRSACSSRRGRSRKRWRRPRHGPVHRGGVGG